MGKALINFNLIFDLMSKKKSEIEELKDQLNIGDMKQKK